MKKILLFFIIFQFISCNNDAVDKYELDEELIKYDSLKKENLILFRQLSDKDSLINAYAFYINEIRKNLNKVRKQQNLIIKEKNNSENLNLDNKDLIQEIEIIGNLMMDNKRLINNLKEGLKNSHLELEEFDKMIVSLTEEVQIKNMEIYYLQEELEGVNASLGELFEAYNEKVLALEEVQDILNTAWFTYGSKDELYKNGVVTKEGGFIGIGKRSILKDDFNKAYFTEIKISDLIEIPLGVKSAKLITSHPASSYELVNNKVVEKLLIKNKEEFWNNSKYLVIVVK